MKKSKSLNNDTEVKAALALKELMKTTAIDKISVADITQKSQIHRQTFYYHFQDKYDLLRRIISSELIDPFTKGINYDNVYDRFNLLFTIMKKDKDFYCAVSKVDSSSIFRFLGDVLAKRFAIIFTTDSFDSERALLASEFFSFGISGLVFGWVQGGMKESPDEMAEKIKTIGNDVKKLASSRYKGE